MHQAAPRGQRREPERRPCSRRGNGLNRRVSDQRMFHPSSRVCMTNQGGTRRAICSEAADSLEPFQRQAGLEQHSQAPTRCCSRDVLANWTDEQDSCNAGTHGRSARVCAIADALQREHMWSARPATTSRVPGNCSSLAPAPLCSPPSPGECHRRERLARDQRTIKGRSTHQQESGCQMSQIVVSGFLWAPTPTHLSAEDRLRADAWDHRQKSAHGAVPVERLSRGYDHSGTHSRLRHCSSRRMCRFHACPSPSPPRKAFFGALRLTHESSLKTSVPFLRILCICIRLTRQASRAALQLSPNQYAAPVIFLIVSCLPEVEEAAQPHWPVSLCGQAQAADRPDWHSTWRQFSGREITHNANE
jgi:hypothetical protein